MSMKHTFKRYCKTLKLVDDPALIEEYRQRDHLLECVFKTDQQKPERLENGYEETIDI